MNNSKCMPFSFTISLSKKKSKWMLSYPASYSNCNHPNSMTCPLFSSCVVCVWEIWGSMPMLEQSTDVCFRRDMEMAPFRRRGRSYGHRRNRVAWNTENTFSGHAEATSLNSPEDSFPLGSQLFIHTGFDHPTIFSSFFIFRPFHVGLTRTL